MQWRVTKLVERFVGDSNAEIVLAKQAYGKFRQGENESLEACARRFEGVMLELELLGASTEEREAAVNFVQSLNKRWFDRGIGHLKMNRTEYHEIRDILLAAERIDRETLEPVDMMDTSNCHRRQHLMVINPRVEDLRKGPLKKMPTGVTE